MVPCRNHQSGTRPILYFELCSLALELEEFPNHSDLPAEQVSHQDQSFPNLHHPNCNFLVKSVEEFVVKVVEVFGYHVLV